MKFNRQHLEELTLQKKYQDLRNIIDHIIGWIKAGHSISLDTIEYIEVVLSEHDKNMNNDQIKAYSDQTIEIQELKKTIQDLTAELEEYRSIAEKIGAEKAVSEKEKLEKIINDTLRALPVGNINTHTPDTIPERVQDWVKEAAEECYFREKWEEIADRLIVYAKEIQATVINQALYEAVCEDIREYNNLKKEFTDGSR